MYTNRRVVVFVILSFAVFMLFGCSRHNTKTVYTMEAVNPTVPEDIVLPLQTEPAAGMSSDDAITSRSEDAQIYEIAEETTNPESAEVMEDTEVPEAVETGTENPPQEPSNTYVTLEDLPEREAKEFVNVRHFIPDIYVELKYSGNDNFTGRAIYDFEDAYLRYGTVMKLVKVCQELAQHDVYLKIWDAFRPASAQFKLWEVFPDPQYVANPNKGYSSHTRGNTVDVTLVDVYGNELIMPTNFDDFTNAANREYASCSEEARQNAMLLESVMEANGFHGYWGEWWHFTDTIKYDQETVFDPGELSVWYPDCNEYITLRERPSAYSDELDRIPLGSAITIMGYTGQFAIAEYMGQRGYVLIEYIKPEP